MADELERLKLELLEAHSTLKVQETKINQLAGQVSQLQERIIVLQRERSSLAPENLATAFKTVLARMQEGLQETNGKIGYQVNRFETQLKVALVLDKDNKLNFQLPKIDDVIPSENLSVLNLAFTQAVPMALPTDLHSIPNLVGLSQEIAVEKITTAGFKIGTINKRVSKSPANTVLGQVPEAYARAIGNSTIDLILAQPNYVTVPNLVGLQLDEALKILVSSRLAKGGIDEQPSASPSGTVLGQSVNPGSRVDFETVVDLAIAVPEKNKVPDLIGMQLDTVKKLLTKLRLRIGKITKRHEALRVGRVVDQDPKPNTNIQVGGQIDLVVGAKSVVETPKDSPTEQLPNHDIQVKPKEQPKNSSTRVIRRKP